MLQLFSRSRSRTARVAALCAALLPALGTVGLAVAAPEDPQLEAKLSALGAGEPAVPSALSAYELAGQKKAGSVEIVAVKGMPFIEAIRLRVDTPPEDAWSFRVQANTTIGLKTGEPMLVMFYARDAAPAGEPGELQMMFRRQGGNFLTSYARTVKLTPEWKKYYIAFPMLIKSKDKPVAQRFESPVGEQMISFIAGFKKQTVEVAGIQALRYPVETSFDQLPNVPITYNGREPDAAWRQTADQRIEQVRKADLKLTVTDAQGNPVPDAAVKVTMTGHEFLWGTAVADPRLYDDKDPDNARYREELLRLFNFASPISSLKWIVWEKSHEAIDTLDWVLAQGMQTRGHALVWPSWRKNPGHLKALESKPEELEKRIEDHMRDIAPHFNGKLTAWDVLNEPFNNRDWINLLGQEKTVEWFKLAKQLEPSAKLYLNENRIIGAYGQLRSEKHQYIEGLVKYLLDQGAPIEGIGMQAHFDEERVTDPEIMWQIIERYAAFGLEMSITEFDVDSPDEKLQADITRDVMTLAFSHPQFKLFQMWGYWDGQHDAFNAPIFRKDWSVKPSGQVYMDLVLGKWWTREAGSTDSQGQYAVRGFKGTYDVEVTQGGKTYHFPVTLTGDATTFEAKLTDELQQQYAAEKAKAEQKKQAALTAVLAAHAERQPPAPPKMAAGNNKNKNTKPQARLDLGTPKGELRFKLGKAGDGVKATYGTWLGKAEENSLVVAHVDVTADAWTPMTVTLEPLSDGNLEMTLKGMFVKGEGAPVWVLYDGITVEGAELKNGDFELSADAPKGWTLAKAGPDKASLFTEAGMPHDGKQSLLVSHDAKATQSLAVKAGQKVTVTAYVRLAPQSAAAAGGDGKGPGKVTPYDDADATRGNDE